jgi:hypothetical protein
LHERNKDELGDEERECCAPIQRSTSTM